MWGVGTEAANSHGQNSILIIVIVLVVMKVTNDSNNNFKRNNCGKGAKEVLYGILL